VGEPGSATLVVGGVSGVGKSTVAREIARSLGWLFAEGDDFHPPANIAKMHAGQPLDDADRAPWLDALAAWIGGCEALRQSAVLTCSALHRRYRDRLRDGHPSVLFCQLTAPEEVLEDRVEHRHGHFMPASLLDSQLEELDPLAADEPGAVVVAQGSPQQVAEAVLAALGLRSAR
jgi:gluconokinase